MHLLFKRVSISLETNLTSFLTYSNINENIGRLENSLTFEPLVQTGPDTCGRIQFETKILKTKLIFKNQDLRFKTPKI